MCAVQPAGHDDRVVSAAFSPDGDRIVSASDDKTVRVWNADGTGQPIVLQGHEAVALVRGDRPVSPDGRRIVSSSNDATVRIWNADGTGKPIVLGVEGFAAKLLHQAAGGVCIEPENAEELAGAVERLANDRAWGHRLGDAGRRHVLRHFDRDKLSNDYLAVIRQTCEVHAGRTAAPAAVGSEVSSGAWEEKRSRLAIAAKS